MAAKRTRQFSVGVDFGTNSVRALVVDVANGRELATEVYAYPSGRAGILSDPRDPNLARQNPADYLRGFRAAVRGAVDKARQVRGFDPAAVVGLGIDTTASTPIPVDTGGTPLAASKRFARNMAAQAWLWKDHTAHAEAAEITDLARRRGEPYLAKCGGTYSSEWFWSKVLHCARTAPGVFRAAHSWVECCDFVPAAVTGQTDPTAIRRSICAAGHKAMYADAWGGLPSKDFLGELAPELAELRDRLYAEAVGSDHVAGYLERGVARAVGLSEGIPVAVGAIDAHFGAVGCGVRPGVLVKVLGTSGCDMAVERPDRAPEDVPGVCGLVPGSIVPGMIGIEAGQSAVGDIYNWFVEHLCPAEFSAKGDPHAALSCAAAKLEPGQSGLLALDWNNGNRSLLIDPLLTGLLVGQTLHTSAPEIYRALIEATAFGALMIVERLEQCGVRVRELVCTGGIAEKNPFLMQLYADVLGRPMKLGRSGQACALGAALFGAVVGGAYRTTQAAQKKMTGVKATVYRPNRARHRAYRVLFDLYRRLHDAFGTQAQEGELFGVMKDLIAIRDRVQGR